MNRSVVAAPPVAASISLTPNRTTMLSVGFLAILALAFWAADGFLLVRLRAIANEAFKSNPANPVLTVDDVNDLNAYSPARLARCLSFPSAQVRTVVCLALGQRRGQKDAKEWDGVLPSLLRALRETNDADVQYAVVQSLLSLSYVPPQDADKVIEFAQEQLSAKEPWWNLCAHLLNVTVDAHINKRPDVLQAFERSLTMPVAQFETTRRLARIAPESKEAAAAVRTFTRENAPNNGIMGMPEVREILIAQPALADELLLGNTFQKLAVFGVAADELGRSEIVLDDASTNARRPRWLTKDRLERIRNSALELVKKTNDPDALIPEHAFRVIWFWRDGSERLFDVARNSTGKRRSVAFSYAVNNKNLSETKRFLTPRLSEVARWLNESDVDQQRWLLRSLRPYFADVEWVNTLDASTTSSIVAASRRLLDQATGRDDELFLSYFANAATAIDSVDADRVAAALVRVLNQMQAGFVRTNYKPQGVLDDAQKRLFDRLGDHRGRESVRRAVDFRRTLEAEGVIGVRSGAGVMMNSATSLHN